MAESRVQFPDSEYLARCEGWRLNMTDYQVRDSETGQFTPITLTSILLDEFDATEQEIAEALAVADSGPVGRLLGRPSA